MKTILITGSTDGIGKLAAQKLIEDGNQVIIHGRDPDKVYGFLHEFKNHKNYPLLKGYVADLSIPEQIDGMNEQLLLDLDHIDVLVNNAGVYNSPQEQNNQGIDMRFAVNYLAPIKITEALLPLLKNSNSPRVINLSSAAQSPVDLEMLNGKSAKSASDAYAQSKLALTMWNTFLAETEKDIESIALNPGSLLNTNMVREAFGKHWSSAEKGADIIYDLAMDDTDENHSGAYYDNDAGRYSRAHEDAYDKEKIQKLMDATKEVKSD